MLAPATQCDDLTKWVFMEWDRVEQPSITAVMSGRLTTSKQSHRQGLTLFIHTHDWTSTCIGIILKFKDGLNDIFKDTSKPSAESCLVQSEIHSFLMSE